MTDESQPVPASASGEAPVPTNPVEEIVGMAREGRYLDAFTTWFQIPLEQRTAAIRETLTRLDPKDGTDVYYDRALRNPAATDSDRFILPNLSLLASVTGEKLLVPSAGTEISLDEIRDFKYSTSTVRRFQIRRFGKQRESVQDEGDSSNLGSFQRKLADFRNEWGITLKWMSGDLVDGNEVIQSKLTDEEIAILLKRVLPHIKSADIEDEDTQFRLGDSLLHPVKHVNIITDSEIGRYFESRGIPKHSGIFESAQVANFIKQHYFPSVEYFEKVFASGQEYTTQDYVFEIQKDDLSGAPAGELPASVLYFTVLRQLVHLGKYTPDDDYSLTPSETARMKERLAGYLFSDAFMERALAYLNTDVEYPDDVIRMDVAASGYISHDLIIIKQGDEARAEKRERLAEVVQAADKFLREKGETEKADELATREVNGIKFADFLKAT